MIENKIISSALSNNLLSVFWLSLFLLPFLLP